MPISQETLTGALQPPEMEPPEVAPWFRRFQIKDVRFEI